MLTILMTVAAFAQASPGQSHPDCLMSVTRALEVSGEDARNVASAVVSACNPTDPLASGPTPPDSLWAKMSVQLRTETIEFARELSRAEVVLMVVRLRACRRTLNCKVDAIALTPH